MSPVLTAPVEAPPAPPERPGYFAVAWATFLGYLFTVLLAFPLVFAAIFLGLDLADASDSLGRGAFYHYDLWSWVAEVFVGVLAVGLTSLMVGHQLRTRTGWEVPFGVIFLTLLVSGYAPVLALTPLYGATGIVSLALAAFILRRRAAPSGAEPTTPLGQLPRRFRRPVALTAAVGVPVMIAYATNTRARSYDREPGKVVRFPMSLRNLGPAATDAEVVRVEGNPTWQLERAGAPVSPIGYGIHRPLKPFDRIGSDEPMLLTLELRQGPTCAGTRATLDAIWLRYTVLGMRHEQRIPLVDGPSVRCR